MEWLLDFLFGCSHPRCGWPITQHGITVRVCLECGRERKYDMRTMRYVKFERGEERKLRTPNYGDGSVLVD
jgi:hypothetical protein